jgi:hypothetical protein
VYVMGGGGNFYIASSSSTVLFPLQRHVISSYRKPLKVTETDMYCKYRKAIEV